MNWFEFDLLSVVPPGHTIIMDNASFHAKKELYEMADRYSVKLLFLPPYSPDFNPIEKFWANRKRWLRDFSCFYDSLQSALHDRLVQFLS
jgi:transposase